MSTIEIMLACVKSISARWNRSLLTVLGVVVGVGTVVLLLAYGAGQKAELLARYEDWGANEIRVNIRGRWGRGNWMSERERLTPGDLDAILKDCGAVSRAEPSVDTETTVRLGSYELEEVEVLGVGPDYFDILGEELVTGEAFGAEENVLRERVCIINTTMQKELFFGAPALGQFIDIAGRRFRIVGTIDYEEGRRAEPTAFMPYLTFTDRTFINQRGLGEIVASAVSSKHVKLAAQQIEELMYLRHPRIEKPDESEIRGWWDKPIRVMYSEELRSQREATADSFGQFLAVIGFLSLLIGGVGVMNIMLVTVHQRTAEIGLRKALGAKREDILRQFLAEAVLISFSGGLIGLGAAWMGAKILANMPEDAQVPDPVISPLIIFIAFAVTVGTGVFFGYYPAWQASRLDPIEALRSSR
ncbi:ABC transporter permease [bacterium]|nr:ABC transporter permease [bacterium]